MPEILLKYEMLDPGDKEKLLGYLDFLLSQTAPNANGKATVRQKSSPGVSKNLPPPAPEKTEAAPPENVQVQWPEGVDMAFLTRPIRKNITAEDLMREQNFTVFDAKGFNEIVERLDIQEPVEHLISQLTP